MEIIREPSGLILTQKKSTLDLLTEFEVSHLKPASSPIDPSLHLRAEQGALIPDPTIYHRLLEKLNFLTNTRPDLSFAV